MDGTVSGKWRKPGRNRLDAALREDIGLAVDDSVLERADPAVLKRVIDGLGHLSVFDVAMVGRAMRGNFEETLRRRRKPDLPSWWRRLGVPDPQGHAGAPTFMTWLNLFHPDGHERERALDAIDTSPPNGFWMAVLTVRAGEWVGQVQDAAARCMERIGPMIDPETFVDGLLFFLNSGATESDRFKQALWAQLRGRPEICTALLARLLTSTDGAANRLFKPIVGDRDLLDGDLRHLAEAARHPVIRARALRVLLHGQAETIGGDEWMWTDKVAGRGQRLRQVHRRPVARIAPVAELILLGARDRAMTVRKVAADGLILHRATLEDPGALLRAFDGEDNATVIDRLDFVRRYLEAAP